MTAAGWRGARRGRHCEERTRRSNPYFLCGDMDCFASLAMTWKVSGLLRRRREQQQISVRIPHDKVPRAPGLPLQRLEKRHPAALTFEEEQSHFFRRPDTEPSQHPLS